MSLLKKKDYLLLSIFIGFILVFPQIIQNAYYICLLNMIGLNVLVVGGLNLLIGYAGQISLGHAAFYGLGAYISGILTAKYGFPPWPSILLAMGMTGAVAYVIGRPTLRLKGEYLVMATLGFNIIIYILMVQMLWLTGGPSGLAAIPYLTIGDFAFDSDVRVYYLIWFFCLCAILLSLNLVHSRVGRGLRAIHDSEVAANATGVDAAKYKVKVFVLSAVLASLAGSLYAHYITFISPDSFGFFYSVQVVTMVIVGGMGNIWGSLFGATILTSLPQLLHLVKEYNIITFGAILTIVLIFFPEGLVFGLVDLWRRCQIHSFMKGGVKRPWMGS